jgi:hypothetical protein
LADLGTMPGMLSKRACCLITCAGLAACLHSALHVQANLGEPELALKSLQKGREMAGAAGLMESESTEWQRLAAARVQEQQVQGASYRLKIVDPK